MDDLNFDRLARTLSTGSPRRHIFAGALAAVAAFHAGEETSAKGKNKHKNTKKKCKKSQKKCGKSCIPQAQCCTDGDCGSGKTCRGGLCVCTPQCGGKRCGPDGCGGSCGQCANGDSCDASGHCPGCTPNCAGKACGSNGCDGSCGTCSQGDACSSAGQCICTPNCAGKDCGPDDCGGSCGTCENTDVCNGAGQCEVCTANCAGKTCGPDGCGGSCGDCQNGTCQGGQCVCPFNEPCAPGQCCPNEQTCQNGACGACPATPDACAVEIICGRTTADSPLCYCVTSLDDVTTCTSVFINPSQTTNCTSDADCVGLLGFGVDMVCVDAPCLGRPVSKVCMNAGCEDLNPGRGRSKQSDQEPRVRQAHWPDR